MQPTYPNLVEGIEHLFQSKIMCFVAFLFSQFGIELAFHKMCTLSKKIVTLSGAFLDVFSFSVCTVEKLLWMLLRHSI